MPPYGPQAEGEEPSMRQVKHAPPRPWCTELMANRPNSLSSTRWTAVSAGQRRLASRVRLGPMSGQHPQGRFSGKLPSKCLPMDTLTTAPNVYRWIAICGHSCLQVDI